MWETDSQRRSRAGVFNLSAALMNHRLREQQITGRLTLLVSLVMTGCLCHKPSKTVPGMDAELIRGWLWCLENHGFSWIDFEVSGAV